jgi:lipoprotein-anchoring transpeptidase ErfK/SrfK
MIRGPFHAVVSKSRFIMDIFLEEPGTHRMIFVKRFGVGVGRDGSTPAGQWRLVHGGKITHAPWTPPASSDLERKRIEWGEPGYPFGTKGYWISLEGTGKTPYTREDGYGIHGTNDPSSIGKASSLGCIRLGDKDIEMLFAILYEKWSTVTILP